VSGTLAAVLVAFLSEDAFGSASTGVLHIGGQGASFVAAGAAFVVDVVVSVLVTMVTRPRRESELRGLVYSLTPKDDLRDEHADHWWLAPTKLAGVSLVMVVILNIIFH
jgi:SSS family solute:Na+ symporter